MNRLVPAMLLLLGPGLRGDQPVSPEVVGMLRQMAAGEPMQAGACRRLAKDPERLLEMLFLPPGADAPDPAKLRFAREWIPRLGSERYPERVEAERRLREAGPGVRPALKEVLASRSPEIRLRAGDLIEGFADHPELAALDYVAVRSGIARVLAAIDDDSRVESLTEQACDRLGTPTLHGQERWLLRPFFAELLRRESPRATALLGAALGSPDEELAASAATALGDHATRRGINRCYLAILDLRAPAALERVLVACPQLEPDDPLAVPFRDALLGIVGAPSMAGICQLRAHRLLLLHFEREESLAAILDAALDGESEVAASALGDPRLIGIRLRGAGRAGKLIDHPDAGVRKAAAMFLTTRPGDEGPRLALTFLPELELEDFNEIRNQVANLLDSSGLRRQLEAEIERKGRAAPRAEQLLWALPEDLLQVAPENPFLFR